MLHHLRGLDAVYQVVEHFALHYGQILYITKLIRGQDLGFYRHLNTTGRVPENSSSFLTPSATVTLPLRYLFSVIFSGYSGARKARTRNLEILRCAIAHHRVASSRRPGMTARERPRGCSLYFEEFAYFRTSSLAMARLCTSSGPSAKRNVRMPA